MWFGLNPDFNSWPRDEEESSSLKIWNHNLIFVGRTAQNSRVGLGSITVLLASSQEAAFSSLPPVAVSGGMHLWGKSKQILKFPWKFLYIIFLFRHSLGKSGREQEFFPHFLLSNWFCFRPHRVAVFHAIMESCLVQVKIAVRASRMGNAHFLVTDQHNESSLQPQTVSSLFRPNVFPLSSSKHWTTKNSTALQLAISALLIIFTPIFPSLTDDYTKTEKAAVPAAKKITKIRRLNAANIAHCRRTGPSHSQQISTPIWNGYAY